MTSTTCNGENDTGHRLVHEIKARTYIKDIKGHRSTRLQVQATHVAAAAQQKYDFIGCRLSKRRKTFHHELFNEDLKFAPVESPL